MVIVCVLQRRNNEEDNKSNSEFTGTGETGKECSCGVCKEERMLRSLVEAECVSVALRVWSSFVNVSISRVCSLQCGFPLLYFVRS